MNACLLLVFTRLDRGLKQVETRLKTLKSRRIMPMKEWTK
jgi:hypothetical protein